VLSDVFASHGTANPVSSQALQTMRETNRALDLYTRSPRAT
jgi:hypothetical protein